jgi:putative transposase
MENYKTMQVWVKKGHRLHEYFEEMCSNAKNMFNTTNFYIRQVFTGLTQEKELLELQKEVLDNIQKHLPKINDNQLVAYQKKFEKEKTKPVEERKDIKCNLFELPSKEHPFVDYHFLDALFKSMVQNDYRSLPTQSSQIIMKTTEESYTSKASFLDHDELPVYGENDPKKPFSGKRIKRGLYRSKNGTLINADVNGAANIMRKVFEKAFEETFSTVGPLLKPVSVVLK